MLNCKCELLVQIYSMYTLNSSIPPLAHFKLHQLQFRSIPPTLSFPAGHNPASLLTFFDMQISLDFLLQVLYMAYDTNYPVLFLQ